MEKTVSNSYMLWYREAKFLIKMLIENGAVDSISEKDAYDVISKLDIK